MECEKCKDRGFTEENHGLIRIFCDCEKGKQIKAEITGKSPDVAEVAPKDKQKPKVIPIGQYWCSKCKALHRIASKIGKRHLKHKQ